MARELKNIVPNTVSIGVIENQKVLNLMRLTIFTADDEAGFITSDSPCSMQIPRHIFFRCIHRSTIPMWNSRCLFLSQQRRRILVAKGCVSIRCTGNPTLANEVNGRTLGWCRTEFVSWKGIVRGEWFGRAPTLSRRNSDAGVLQIREEPFEAGRTEIVRSAMLRQKKMK